uniref:Uncharacterized protein n=1 Tax=Amphimedon queenslandica TaxID=400682 RepID=A0A1X7SZZ7_AMPQE
MGRFMAFNTLYFYYALVIMIAVLSITTYEDEEKMDQAYENKSLTNELERLKREKKQNEDKLEDGKKEISVLKEKLKELEKELAEKEEENKSLTENLKGTKYQAKYRY